MGTLQNYINAEETDERAKDNKRVDLKYVGPLKHLKGKRGTGYFIVSEDRWYFRPNVPDAEYPDAEYRVNSQNLDFIGDR